MEIANKIAIVTGGGSGMGAETAMYLHAKGARVAILDVNEEAATKLAEKVDGFALACNVSDAPATEKAIQKIKEVWGIPRICVNCAGIAPAKRMVGREGPMPLEDFTKVINVNLVGTFNVMRLVAALMIEDEKLPSDTERGVIINTASVAAFEGQIGQAAYSASKAGVCGLALPVARELAPFGIRVMTIAPGLIETPMFAGFTQEVQERLAETVTFPKRLGKPIEFAMLVGHIVENSYLNGEVIRLDGGVRLQAK